MIILDTIKNTMKKKKVTQKDLAKHLELSQATVCRILDGKIDLNMDKLYKIAELLGLKVSIK
jgi:transcriptional regulator with XRE-family HTH domain